MLAFVFSVNITRYLVLKSILLAVLTFGHKLTKEDLKVLSTVACQCLSRG